MLTLGAHAENQRLQSGRNDEADGHTVLLAGGKLAHPDGDELLAGRDGAAHLLPVLQDLDPEGARVAHLLHVEDRPGLGRKNHRAKKEGKQKGKWFHND